MLTVHFVYSLVVLDSDGIIHSSALYQMPLDDRPAPQILQLTLTPTSGNSFLTTKIALHIGPASGSAVPTVATDALTLRVVASGPSPVAVGFGKPPNIPLQAKASPAGDAAEAGNAAQSRAEQSIDAALARLLLTRHEDVEAASKLQRAWRAALLTRHEAASKLQRAWRAALAALECRSDLGLLSVLFWWPISAKPAMT